MRGTETRTASLHGPLARIYDDLWSEGRAALSDDRIETEPLPVDGAARWGISAVVRPRPWSAALSACAETCARLMGRNGLVYGPDNFHITVKSLEGHRTDVSENDQRLQAFVAALTAIADRWRAIEVRLRGLAASPAGVIVQGWPSADLQALRIDLHEQMAASGCPVRGPEADLSRMRTTAHATLSIYGDVVARRAALIAFVDDHRETCFGDYAFDRIFLVGYRRTRDAVELIDYGSFAFRGASSCFAG